MNSYELTYFISADAGTEGALAKAKEVEGIIQQHQGVIVQQSAPVSKMLSYPIQGKSSAFYVTTEFTIEPSMVKEVHDLVGKDAQIIRSLLTTKPPVKIKKEKRTKPVKQGLIATVIGAITGSTEAKKEEVKEPEAKPVALKDIDEQLEKILGE